jgi:hypothetical protein
VCVIGAKAAHEYFGKESPIGKSVSLVLDDVKQVPIELKIVGVHEAKDADIDGGTDKRDWSVAIPWTVVAHHSEGGKASLEYWTILAKAVKHESVPAAIRECTDALRRLRSIKTGSPDNFFIEDMNHFIDETANQRIAAYETSHQKGGLLSRIWSAITTWF